MLTVCDPVARRGAHHTDRGFRSLALRKTGGDSRWVTTKFRACDPNFSPSLWCSPPAAPLTTAARRQPLLAASVPMPSCSAFPLWVARRARIGIRLSIQ